MPELSLDVAARQSDTGSTSVVKKVRKPRTKKLNKLSDTQVKINHVNSEQKRRTLLRAIYDELVVAVPDLTSQESRSELVIYMKTINYMKWLYKRNAFLRSQLISKQNDSGTSSEASIPHSLIWESKELNNS